jgi:hypothetical protein
MSSDNIFHQGQHIWSQTIVYPTFVQQTALLCVHISNVRPLKVKALVDNQIKVQPKTSECYGTIVKTKKHIEFPTHRLKEERRYKVALKYAQLHYH